MDGWIDGWTDRQMTGRQTLVLGTGRSKSHEEGCRLGTQTCIAEKSDICWVDQQSGNSGGVSVTDIL